MNRRYINLFKLLASSSSFLSVDYLCAKLNIKPRTLRDDLKSVRDDVKIEAGAQLISKSNQGYKLSITDENKFYHFMQDLLKDEANQQFLMPILQVDRVNYIIRKFLSADDYLKSEDIADEMFIARSTFSSDLKIVKDKLSEFNLVLDSRVGSGLKIAGNELDFRSCISQFFFHNSEFQTEHIELPLLKNFDIQIKDKISEILYKTIKQEQFRLTDFGFQNLVIHLVIAINRIRGNTFLDDRQINASILVNSKEFEIANKIALNLETEFNIIFPKSEICYITIHFMGKRVFSQDDDSIIEVSTLNLVKRIIDEIMIHFNLNFSGDIELFTSLALHIQPLINRIKFGLHLHNPLICHLQEKNPLAYDIALVAYQEIQKLLKCNMDENEVGYLALHFQLAIQRININKKQNILVICASGAGTARILMHRITHVFKDQIGFVKHASAFELDEMNLSDFHLILSTIPLNKICPIPVIQVNYDLNSIDIENVMKSLTLEFKHQDIIQKTFKKELFITQITLDNKIDIIKMLCHELSKYVTVPNGFLESILKREELASTDIGNNVAIPHPMRLMMEETVILFAHLKKPIKWGKNKVSLVLLLAMQKDDNKEIEQLSNAIISLVHNYEIINQIKNNPDYDEFIKYITNVYQETIKYKEDSIFA